MTDEAKTACACGAPLPKRPTQDRLRPRCDACEVELLKARKRASAARSSRKAPSCVKAMTRAQRP